MRSKVCKWCEKELPLTEFHTHPQMADGHVNKCKACTKAYRESRKEEREAYQKAWHAKNAEAQQAYRKEYHENNKEYFREYAKNKRATDTHYKLSSNLRARLRAALKGVTKGQSVLKLVGVPIEQIIEHLESQFTEGMTWDNYGEWHVDHIRPLKSFDNPEDPEAWALTNLQPLWAADNIRKGSKYNG